MNCHGLWITKARHRTLLLRWVVGPSPPTPLERPSGSLRLNELAAATPYLPPDIILRPRPDLSGLRRLPSPSRGRSTRPWQGLTPSSVAASSSPTHPRRGTPIITSRVLPHPIRLSVLSFTYIHHHLTNFSSLVAFIISDRSMVPFQFNIQPDPAPKLQ